MSRSSWRIHMPQMFFSPSHEDATIPGSGSIVKRILSSFQASLR